jgi:hypothetical protein
MKYNRTLIQGGKGKLPIQFYQRPCAKSIKPSSPSSLISLPSLAQSSLVAHQPLLDASLLTPYPTCAAMPSPRIMDPPRMHEPWRLVWPNPDNVRTTFSS